MQLNELRDNLGASKSRKRIGRGIGSGKGKTAGHGHKGQKARTGVAIKGFEGGQMPLQRRLPKRGFVSHRAPSNIINLFDLQKAVERKRIDASKPVNAEVLAAAGLIPNATLDLRILAKGALTSKLQITADHVSSGARAAIEKAGGSVTVVEKKPVAEAAPKQTKA
jgi:large subunit ribosomal protein L15